MVGAVVEVRRGGEMVTTSIACDVPYFLVHLYLSPPFMQLLKSNRSSSSGHAHDLLEAEQGSLA